MIAHLRDRAAALMTHGWTRREAEWLALVCRHSGVFFCSQYLAFIGRTNPALANRFIRRCRKLAVEQPWHGSRLRLCRIASRALGPSDVGDSGQSGRRARSPNRMPARANQIREVLTTRHRGQIDGHARRDVVPGGGGLREVRRVEVDQDRQRIVGGERSRPRGRTRTGHAADDHEDADAAINHRAARWRVRSRPWAGVGAFPQGYIETGATPLGGVGV